MYFSEQGNVDDDATIITIFFNFIQFTVLLPQSAVCSLQSANGIHRFVIPQMMHRVHKDMKSS